jgi:uncharacterized Zn finger protein (UPF0148 family)
MTEKVCAYDECNNTYHQTAHNKIYCSDECCRKATNKKIMEKYYAKKRRRSGATIECDQCGAPLSRYSDHSICAFCQGVKKKAGAEMVKNKLRNVKWAS